MTYTVLARRYRSQTFDGLIGQEAIATTLKNAITSSRVAHAYLFTGTRGVGKTSAARILAKALNCEGGPTPEPCGKCSICMDIARGEDVDVIEIDGASNTGVDDIRELRSNAIYRPARARYKIYIIDEVHMISTSAFNALLKTLEEPPEHVKFIFATTEPNKVPITIQSRCQRFDFRPISKEKIARHLHDILASEKVKVDDQVVDRIARLANGSMRDALSLIDRLLSLGQQEFTIELAEQFLPVQPVEQYADLAQAFIDEDAAAAIVQTENILATGVSAPDFCSALTEYVRDLMVASACDDCAELLASPTTAHAKILVQAQALKPLVWSYGITILEELARGVKFSEQPRSLIDSAMVTLASLPRLIDLASISPKGAAARPAQPVQPPKKKVNESTAAAGLPEPTDKSRPAGTDSANSPASAPTGQFHAALAEPVVRKLMDVFEARLLDVRATPRQK
jgi:DNA polymerase-3 subunit gamma/tau